MAMPPPPPPPPPHHHAMLGDFLAPYEQMLSNVTNHFRRARLMGPQMAADTAAAATAAATAAEISANAAADAIFSDAHARRVTAQHPLLNRLDAVDRRIGGGSLGPSISGASSSSNLNRNGVVPR
jgi:hypothetical protein